MLGNGGRNTPTPRLGTSSRAVKSADAPAAVHDIEVFDDQLVTQLHEALCFSKGHRHSSSPPRMPAACVTSSSVAFKKAEILKSKYFGNSPPARRYFSRRR